MKKNNKGDNKRPDFPGVNGHSLYTVGNITGT